VLPLFRKVPKLMRAAAVALLVILTSLSPIFLIHSPESLSLPTTSALSPQDDAIATLATRFWVVIVLFLFASCAWFGWTHLRHIHKDALHYFDHFKELSRANFSGTPKEAAKWDDSQLSTLHDDAVEGESTLRLLLTIIYGIIAMSGSTIAYFITGQHLDLVGDSVPFIFANNEGFTAALSLLIIVLASAAIPIYSDLVKKIDEETDSFEHEISVLAQNINGLSIGADAIWKHFTDVGLPLFKEWQSSLDEHQNRNPEFLSEIQFKQIFLPYLIFQATRPDGIDNYDDYPPRLLDPFFPVVETLNEEGESLETLFQDSYKQLIDGVESRDHEYFFRNPDMGPTRTRVVSWLSDWHLLGTEIPDSLIMEADQINRARAIMVQAWCLEGPDKSAENLIPHKSSEHHIPPSEHILYSLLTAHDFLPSEINTNEPEHQSLRRFKSRIRRHLNEIQKTEQDQPSSDRLNRLIQQCDELDIDASVFWDDVILFQQIAGALTSQSQSESQIRSALSRFLYYIIWYFSSFDTRTKIGTLLNRHAEGPEASTDTQAAEEGNEADNEAAVVADEATDAVAEIEAPTSAPGIRTRFEELHTHFSGDTFEEPTDKTRLTALLLADRRSALHNWIRATQAHRSRRVLLRFEAKLDEIQVYRQLGIQIIPSRSARLRHLRYLVRAPRVSRHPLRLVSTFDLPPESTSEARQRMIATDFNARIVGNEFKQLREVLNFSKRFVKYSNIPQSIIRRILSTEGEAGSKQTLPTEDNLTRKTRKYLEWILRAMKPDGEARNLSDKDLVSEALQHVSHRYNVLKTKSFRPDPGWQETQWNKLFDYCRNPAHHADLKQTFFSIQKPNGTTQFEQENFDAWWERFNSR